MFKDGREGRAQHGRLTAQRVTRKLRKWIKVSSKLIKKKKKKEKKRRIAQNNENEKRELRRGQSFPAKKASCSESDRRYDRAWSYINIRKCQWKGIGVTSVAGNCIEIFTWRVSWEKKNAAVNKKLITKARQKKKETEVQIQKNQLQISRHTRPRAHSRTCKKKYFGAKPVLRH